MNGLRGLSPREEDGKRNWVDVGRMVKRMTKAVWWSVMGFGALSSGDMGAPAEWLSRGAGYAGVKRWRKENKFLSRHCRTLAEAKGCGVEIRGVSGPRIGRCDGWVWLGWRSAVPGVCGLGVGWGGAFWKHNLKL